MSSSAVRYRALHSATDSDDEIDIDLEQQPTDSNDTERLLNRSDEEASSSERIALQRNIGIFSGANIVVGSMIGSGIFIVPTGVLKHCNGNVPATMLAWVFGGLIAVITALCFCELGTMFPSSGGAAAYLKVIYGDAICFVYMWLFMFATQPQSTAVQVIALGDYISRAIQSVTHQCSLSESKLLSKLIGSVFCIALLVCNIRNVKLATKLQVICTVGKVLALIIICVCGVIMMMIDTSVLKSNFGLAAVNASDAILEASTISSGVDFKSVGITEFSLGLFQAMWAYDGFDNILLVTEEVKKPKRTLPAIIIISVLFVMLLYLLVNVSYFSVLTEQEMISSTAVAVSFAAKIHPALTYVVTGGVCLSLFGSINVAFLTSGRVPYVAGRYGFMPEILSMVHIKYYSPVTALIFLTFFFGIMLIPSSIEMLLQAVVFIAWTFRALCVIGLLVMRRTDPEAKRPYRVYLLTAIIATLAVLYIAITPLAFDPQVLYLVTLGLGVVFFVLYWLQRYKLLKLTGVGPVTIACQKLLLVVTPDS